MKQAGIVKKTTVPFNAYKSKETAVDVKKVSPVAETIQEKKHAQKTECCLQKIQEKAYELYLKRNGGPGSAEEDWAQAEKIVKG